MEIVDGGRSVTAYASLDGRSAHHVRHLHHFEETSFAAAGIFVAVDGDCDDDDAAAAAAGDDDGDGDTVADVDAAV